MSFMNQTATQVHACMLINKNYTKRVALIEGIEVVVQCLVFYALPK